MSGAGRGEMQYDMCRKNVEKVPFVYSMVRTVS
jgi:hypothetical protein